MKRILLFVAGLLALSILAMPAAAHHKPGHSGGPPGQRGGSDKDRGNPHSGQGSWDNDNDDNDADGPPSGPGNSGAAHWCKKHFDDPDAEHQFPNHGQCVSWHAHQRNADRFDDDDDFDDDDINDNNDNGDNGSTGQLEIMDVKIREDGTFRVRGVGAEDLVIVWIDDADGNVVGFGQADPEGDGDWTVEGNWACIDQDSDEGARFRARDFNETDSRSATFPCDELD